MKDSSPTPAARSEIVFYQGEDELDPSATVKQYLTVRTEGSCPTETPGAQGHKEVEDNDSDGPLFDAQGTDAPEVSSAV